VLVGGDQTQGQVALLEMTARAGDAPPFHVHTREDELIYVLRGEITVDLDGTRRLCGAGDFALLPRGSEHAWRVDSGEAVLLLLLAPAGLEGYYRELAGPERHLERLIATSARYGIEIVGPTLASTS
jgi:quercetin dioxygenase-like cupin family protein